MGVRRVPRGSAVAQGSVVVLLVLVAAVPTGGDHKEVRLPAPEASAADGATKGLPTDEDEGRKLRGRARGAVSPVAAQGS